MPMHKLTAGDGYAYLTRHVAAGDAGLGASTSLTAYYEQTGNPRGRWMGGGLAGLGDGTRRLAQGDAVTEKAMTAVFRDGRDPLTDDALCRPYRSTDDAHRHAVVGYDLTFTAPKSASVLWALADDATRTVIYAAHRAALAARHRDPHPGGAGRPRAGHAAQAALVSVTKRILPSGTVTWRAKVFFERRVIAQRSHDPAERAVGEVASVADEPEIAVLPGHVPCEQHRDPREECPRRLRLHLLVPQLQLGHGRLRLRDVEARVPVGVDVAQQRVLLVPSQREKIGRDNDGPHREARVHVFKPRKFATVLVLNDDGDGHVHSLHGGGARGARCEERRWCP